MELSWFLVLEDVEIRVASCHTRDGVTMARAPVSMTFACLFC